MTLADIKTGMPNWGFGTRILVEGIEYKMCRGWGNFLCWTDVGRPTADSFATIKDAALYRRHNLASPVTVTRLVRPV
jgi:hypothetical protein